MTSFLDVLTRSASDPRFSSRFARDPIGAAHAIGMRTRPRGHASYLEARLEALAQPLDREPGPYELEETAAEMSAALGLEPSDAAKEATRALLFLRDYRFHQRLANNAPPGDLMALIDGLPGDPGLPGDDRGTLVLTLHYGAFQLLWLWLKHAEGRNVGRRFTLLYDANEYTPDVSPGQYRRLAAAGTVPSSRRDLDMGKLGVRGALREAVARLRSGETILMFPDAFAVPAREGALVCRVGRLDVAYPRGAVWLAQQTDATVQGAVVRPKGDGHEIWWGTPRPGPATHTAVTEAVQELLDHSVARDPAAWLAWFTDDAASAQAGS
jgi:hypothetical protein